MSIGVIWNLFSVIVRLALGGILLWAGLSKMQRPYEFLEAVNRYSLLAPQGVILISALLPWIEVMVGLCLLIGLLTGGALVGCMLLSAVFIVAQSSALWRGLLIPCGCSGGDSYGTEIIDHMTIARSCFMLLAAAAVYIHFLTRGLKVDARSTRIAI